MSRKMDQNHLMIDGQKQSYIGYRNQVICAMSVLLSKTHNAPREYLKMAKRKHSCTYTNTQMQQYAGAEVT